MDVQLSCVQCDVKEKVLVQVPFSSLSDRELSHDAQLVMDEQLEHSEAELHHDVEVALVLICEDAE